jgi:HD-like signal output (HDOD) protein
MSHWIMSTAEYTTQVPQAVEREALMRFATDLPALPHTAAKLLHLLNDPNVDNGTIADAAQQDAAVAFTIVKLANSAAFARQRQVSSVAEGIGVIGLSNVRSVVLAQTLAKLNRAPGPFDRLVRDNAVATAIMAKAVAFNLGRHDADALFLCGVLHRLGQFVLAAHPQSRPLCLNVLARIAAYGEDYVTAERAELGLAHPMIGALVANRWNLPGDLAVVLLQYHRPFEGIEGDADFKVGLVKFADAAAHYAGLGSPVGYPDQSKLVLELGQQLGILKNRPKQELAELMEDFKTVFARDAALWS